MITSIDSVQLSTVFPIRPDPLVPTIFGLLMANLRRETTDIIGLIAKETPLFQGNGRNSVGKMPAGWATGGATVPSTGCTGSTPPLAAPLNGHRLRRSSSDP